MKKIIKKILGAGLIVVGVILCISEADSAVAALISGGLGLFLFVCGLYLLTRGS